MAGEVTSVTLSRPRLASTPITTPRPRPGLRSAGIAAEQAVAMSAARPRRRATSRPIAAAGTTPKSESAE